MVAAVLAQDKVTLKNGDVLTGSIKTMAEGKLTLSSPVLGDVEVPFSDIENLSTAAPVQLRTTEGDLIRRRIAGLEAGKIKLHPAGEGAPMLSEMAIEMLDQINPPEKPPVVWTGSVLVGAGFSSGNTDRRSINAAFQASRRSEVDRTSADASWDYAEDKRTDDPSTPGDESGWDLTQRRVGAGIKYDYFISKKVYTLVNGRVLSDTLADLDLRLTAGAGVGYQWVETDDTRFSTELGVSYLREEYRSDSPSQDYVAARIAYRYEQQLTEATRIIHSVEAFPSVEDKDDIYLQLTVQLQNKIFDGMVAQVGWVWDYDNTPAPGRERSDHRVTLAIGWTF